MSRESLRLQAQSILELIAWGEAAEQANAVMRELADSRLGEITFMQGVVAEKDATIAAKDAEIFTLTQFNGELANAVNERDAEIADLIEENVGFEMQHARDRNEIERLKAELALRPDRDMFTAWWTQDKP